jgi:TatD DNase family protein
VIDAHCHLYSDKYNHDIEYVIRQARERLAAAVVSAVDLESLMKSLAIRRRHPNFIYVTAGIHPRKTAELGDEERRQFWNAVGRVRGEIVAVGEVGPDFHHIRDAQRQLRQLLVLEEALTHAEQWNLPLVVHARQAEAAALEVLSRSQVPVMFHCFAGTNQIAKEIADHGFYLSFSALILAYPELKEAVKKVPLELILTETDSPALSPRPSQARNEPAFLETIVTHLAKLLQCSPERASEITETNARRFYRLEGQAEK